MRKNQLEAIAFIIIIIIIKEQIKVT